MGAIVISPWAYGAVEDVARYVLCFVVCIASVLSVAGEARDGTLSRGTIWILVLPGFAMAQWMLGQTVAPLITLESVLVVTSMAAVWAAVHERAGARATNMGRRLAMALIISASAQCLFAAVQWSLNRTALYGRTSGLQTMPFGSYVNHNNFAGFVSLALPVAIAMALGDLRRSGRLTPRGLALLGTACGLAITVFASGSRGALVALFIGLSALTVFSIQRGGQESPQAAAFRRFAILAVAVLLIGAISAIPGITRSRLLNVFEIGGSGLYRIDMLMASVRAFAERPVMGYGLGAFGDAVAPFKLGHGDVRSDRAEGDAIEFLVEGGALLVLALFAFGVFVWREAAEPIARGRDRSGRWLRLGALAGCFTMLVHSLFDFGFRIPANALAFAILLGIATATTDDEPRPAPRLWGSIFLILVLSVAGLCAYRAVGAAGEKAAQVRTSPEGRVSALGPVLDKHPYLTNARRRRAIAWTALAYSTAGYDRVRLDRARADLERVVRDRPRWGEAWADLAWVKYLGAHTEEAQKDMSLATALDPTHIGIGLSHAQLLVLLGDTSSAVTEIRRLRSVNPQWHVESARSAARAFTENERLIESIH